MTHQPAALHAKSCFSAVVARNFDRLVFWPIRQLSTGLAGALASITVLATLLSLVACGQRPSPAPAGTAGGSAITRGGELVASFRTDPTTFNRYMSRDSSTTLLSILTQ